MKRKSGSSRREFVVKAGLATAGLATTALAATGQSASGSATSGSTPGSVSLDAASYRRVRGANEKINTGFIGVGNRGSQLLSVFMKQPDVRIAAFSDAYEPYMLRDRNLVDPRYIRLMGSQIPQMGETFPDKVEKYADFRKLLDNKDIDAVVIATPDHWHAIQMIQAVKAGKDVYVEKPLTITIKEGRAMVKAQEETGRVVAVGLNRRGNPVYQKLAKEIPTGKLGKVTIARAYRVNNLFPSGIGRMKPEAPPANFNWDMWLGPRASRPYQYNICPYMFRWWGDYSSQMGNWGVHYMDVMRWLMGEKAPVAISAHGGKWAIDDDGTIPDTMQVTYEFASGSMIAFCIYEATSGGLFQYGEIELRGTKGTLNADENGYRITPAKAGQFQTWKDPMAAEQFDAKTQMLADNSNADSTTNLIKNFIECVKTRATPLVPLEEGHRSTSFAHLANIAFATKERLQWDPEKEVFTNSEAANRMLHYEYRKPWGEVIGNW